MKNISIFSHEDHFNLETMVNDWIDTFDIEVTHVAYQFIVKSDGEEHVVIITYEAKDELAN
jgi:hypothetical protein